MKRHIFYWIFYLFSIIVIFLFCFKFNNQINACKVAILSKLQEQQERPLSDFQDYPVFTHTGKEWYQDNRLIYHAGGGIDGLSYTNSLEALKCTVSKERFYIEIDFSYTADHKLVCIHSWDEPWGDPESEEAPLFDEYINGKIYGKYTTLSAADLIDFMKTHPALHIIVDTKEPDFLEVIEDLTDTASRDPEILNRLIIQLYTAGMKSKVQKIYPFPDENILFTAYMFGTERTGSILELCYKENISVVTTKENSWDDETVQFFRSKGIIIFEHTINRPDLARQALSRGIHGIYTDFLSPEDLRTDPL